MARCDVDIEAGGSGLESCDAIDCAVEGMETGDCYLLEYKITATIVQKAAKRRTTAMVNDRGKGVSLDEAGGEVEEL